jgi:hypothetical protein
LAAPQEVDFPDGSSPAGGYLADSAPAGYLAARQAYDSPAADYLADSLRRDDCSVVPVGYSVGLLPEDDCWVEPCSAVRADCLVDLLRGDDWRAAPCSVVPVGCLVDSLPEDD